MDSFSCFSTVCKTDKIFPQSFEKKGFYVDFFNANLFLIRLIVVQFRGNRAHNFNRPHSARSAALNSLAQFIPGLYSTQSSYHC